RGGRRRHGHDAAARQRADQARRVGFDVHAVTQRVLDRLDGADAVEGGVALGDADEGNGGHSTNPLGNGSLGSSMYCAVPVTQARPVMVGMTAGMPATSVVSTSRPVKLVPMNDSFTKSVCSGSSPRACSCAIRALVPVPQGERSNQPGWMAIACRECRAVDPGAFRYTWWQ